MISRMLVDKYLELISSMDYIEYEDIGAKYGRLKSFLDSNQFLEYLSNKLNEIEPQPLSNDSDPGFYRRASAHKPLEIYRFSVRFLAAIKESKEPGRMATNIAYESVREKNIANAVSKLCVLYLHPIENFITDYCDEDIEPMKNGLSYDIDEILEMLNSAMLSQQLLLIPTKYFKPSSTDINHKQIFLIGSFTDYFVETLVPALEEALSHETLLDYELTITTADQPNTNDIVMDIWNGIRASGIIIVDMTQTIERGKKLCNFNVAYEMAIAHSYGKPVIILANNDDFQSLDDLPFDLGKKRAIHYSRSDIKKLKNDIVPYIHQAYNEKTEWPLHALTSLLR